MVIVKMLLCTALLLCCGALGLVAGIPGQAPPNLVPSLLMSGRQADNVSVILRLDGDPVLWMDHYRNGIPIRFGTILGSEPLLTGFRALATHHSNGMIFWSNPQQNDIEWMPNFYHNTAAISDIHLGASGNVNGMAADWLSHNLYWTDTDQQIIVMAAVADPHLATGQAPYHIRLMTSAEGLEAPWGIAVDPFKGKIYWTDATLLTVNSANLAGKNIQVIYQGSPGEKPTSLCLDVAAEKLYWIDEEQEAIISSNTDGSGVVHLHDYVDEGKVTLRGITLQGNYLFLTGSTDKVAGSLLFVVNKLNVHDNLRLNLGKGTSANEIVELFDITFLAPQQQLNPFVTPTAVCDGIGKACPHLCVGYQDVQQFTCLCAAGYTVDASNLCMASGTLAPPPSITKKPVTPSIIVNVNNGQKQSQATTRMTTRMIPTPAPVSDDGGVHNNVVIAVSVAIVGLILITAIIACLVCYVLRHKRKKARAARNDAVVIATVTQPQPQNRNNPTYGAQGGELPPDYMVAMSTPSPGENQYENVAFDYDYDGSLDEKKEKL